MIVKLLRSLDPPDGPWLIYDRSRKFYGVILDGEIGSGVRVAMGDDLCAYFETTTRADGSLALNKRVEDQGW